MEKIISKLYGYTLENNVLKKNKLEYKIKNYLCYLNKIDKDEFILISYDIKKNISKFRHIKFEKDKIDVIKSINFYMNPKTYMNENDNKLEINTNLYLFHNVIGNSLKDELYNTKLKKSISADKISKNEDTFDDELMKCERYMYDSETDTKESIYYYVNKNTLETDAIYSELLNNYINMLYSDSMYADEDDDEYYDDYDYRLDDDDDDYYDDYYDFEDYDSSIKISDLVSFEEYDMLKDEEKEEFLFNSAMRFLEQNFLRKCSERKKVTNKTYVKK